MLQSIGKKIFIWFTILSTALVLALTFIDVRDKKGVIATVGSILLFALIAFLVLWLKKKGFIEFYAPTEEPRSFMNDPQRTDTIAYWIRQGYKDFPR